MLFNVEQKDFASTSWPMAKMTFSSDHASRERLYWQRMSFFIRMNRFICCTHLRCRSACRVCGTQQTLIPLIRRKKFRPMNLIEVRGLDYKCQNVSEFNHQEFRFVTALQRRAMPPMGDDGKIVFGVGNFSNYRLSYGLHFVPWSEKD